MWYSQERNFETYICISIHDLRDRVNVNFVLFYRDIAKEVSEINLKINFAQRFNRTMNGKHDVIELISLYMKFENMNLFLTKCNLITKKNSR